MAHYDRRAPVDESRRSASPTFNFREAQNGFKRALIDKVQSRARTVLDLGCGQGGDLVKWAHVGCEYYIGVDISAKSIEAAKDRFSSARDKFLRYGEPPCMPTAIFHAGDMTSFRFDSLAHPPIDVVSSMFSLHYVIGSETFKTMVRNLINDLAFHDQTRWIMYVPNVGKVPAVRCLYGHVAFEHADDDAMTRVTITDCIDKCMEPRIDFRTGVIPIMESLGFVCEEHGGPDDLGSSVPGPEMQACRLFHWGIFRCRWSRPLPGAPVKPIMWLEKGDSLEPMAVKSRWNVLDSDD